MNWDELSKEFAPEAVHWRVQGKPYERNGTYSAMALAYIDARDVMDRLDAACGPENWQDEYEITSTGVIICKLGIRDENAWIWKSDGAGETAVEGKKGGLSDALKRAAVKWGIGRYLYRLDSPWVRCDVRDNNGKKQWKKWAEDPWGKVKSNPYQEAENNRETQAFEAAVQSAVQAIEHESDMDGLAEYFADLNGNQRNVAGDSRVIKAKDSKKKEIQAANQAGPDIGDGPDAPDYDNTKY